MKKTPSITILISLVLLLLISCSNLYSKNSNQTLSTEQSTRETVHREDKPIPQSYNPHDGILQEVYFDSVTSLVGWTDNISDDWINEIKNEELSFYSEEDFKNRELIKNSTDSIFEQFLRTTIDDSRIVYPIIDGNLLNLAEEYDYCISLVPSGACRLPWICYIGNDDTNVMITPLGTELMENESHTDASWIMEKTDPLGMNLKTFEDYKTQYLDEGYASYEYTSMYAKEYSLPDRIVNTVVIDHSTDPSHPSLVVYFSYDNCFVCLYGNPDQVNAYISGFSLAYLNSEELK